MSGTMVHGREATEEALRPHIGLQLWTLRDLVVADPFSALAAAASAGFTTVELAGFADRDPGVFGAALAAAGLEAASAHVSYRLLCHSLAEVVHGLRVVGCSRVAVPAFSAELLGNSAAVASLAASLDQIGRRLADEGFAFSLHNEESQHVALAGVTPWDILVEATDPALVALQLDVFTLEACGLDSVELIGRHAERVTSLHVCDRRDGRYVPIGTGEIRWPPIVAALAGTACRFVFIEDEEPVDPLAASRVSREALDRLLRA